jgi:hypothetical protein
MVMLGDLSSFSASGVNSWVIVLILALIIETDELRHLDRPFIVTIDGLPIEVTLSHVLRLYLYLVVFAPYESDGEEHFATGGYLGVNANMTLTTLGFAIHVADLQDQIRSMVLMIWSQIGGDDFVHVVIGRLSRCLEVMQKLSDEITTFQGRLKDPSIHVIDLTREGSYWLPATYCKKPVEVTVTPGYGSSRVRLRTVHVPPTMCQFLEPHFDTMPLPQATKMYFEFVSGCLDCCRKIDRGDEYLALLLNVFRLLNHRKDLPEYTVPRAITCPVPVFPVGSWWCTEDALRQVESVPSLYDSLGYSYRYTPATRASYLLGRERLRMIRMWVPANIESPELVLVTSEQFNKYSSRTGRERIPLPTHSDLTCYAPSLAAIYARIRISLASS